MAFIIDRRENPSGKNLGNRQRFIRRAKDQIREAVKNSIRDKTLKELTDGKGIIVPLRGLKEPSFGHDPKIGRRNYTLPGNKEFVENDQIARPTGDGGSGSSGSPDSSGEDDFTFIIKSNEFKDVIYEDLELPNLAKTVLNEITSQKNKRSGYTNSGNPVNVDVRQTARLALARRIALKRPDDDDVANLQNDIDEALLAEDYELAAGLQTQLTTMQHRMKVIPWIDPIDIRYRNFVPKPVPNVQAVIFAIMDVSGSMGEREKDIAKRFFLLLHMFLTTKYKKVDIVFIRHTHEAQECDEETFFHDKATGGTVVSTALTEMLKITKERYPINEWNIYIAQASDGDNYSNDSALCNKLLTESILPICQYMAYIEITPVISFTSLVSDKDLWKAYKLVPSKWTNFQMKKIANISEIYPVFRELFSKEAA